MNKVRFAIIGFGHIGKRHAEMIARNANAELKAICDTNSEILQSHVESKTYSDYQALLQNESNNIDVVCICTPNGLHAAMANEAIKAGYHVLIEKPLGLSKTNCEEVIFNAFNEDKQVFCVMQNRYSPPSQWLKEIVDNKVLGEIYMVQLNCFWNRDNRYYKPGGWHGNKALDGGTLFTQFSHFIDVMYWLFGDIDNISSRFYDFNHKDTTEFEDSGIIHFDFVNGGVGSMNFTTSVYDKNQESSITIIGENGSVKVGGQYMNEVEYCHIKGYQMPSLDPVNPANDYGAFKGSAANHVYVIQNVIDVLNGKGRKTTNALEGLKVVDIIERMYKAKVALNP